MRVLQFIRSRLAVVAAAVVLAGALLWGYADRGALGPAWADLGVPTLPVTFADLRAVLGCIDCDQSGFDPYIEANHCYPLGGRFNLPRAWLWLGYLGANQDRANVIGFLYMLIEFIAFALIFRPQTKFTAAAAFLAILSPPMLLGMERGNGDLLIFSLLVIGLALAMRLAPQGRRWAVGGLLTFLTAMKIYPAVAAAAIIRRKKTLPLPSSSRSSASSRFFSPPGRCWARFTPTRRPRPMSRSATSTCSSRWCTSDGSGCRTMRARCA